MKFDLTYYTDPGLLIDTIKLISLNINDKRYLTQFSLPDPLDEKEIAFIKEHLHLFSRPPQELLLFFFKRNDTSANFILHYLIHSISNGFKHFSLKTLLNELTNSNLLKQELCKFYLDIPYESHSVIENVLRTTSSLPEKIKFYLLGFCIHPAPYLHMLISCIKSYYDQICTHFSLSSPALNLNTESLLTLIQHADPVNSHTIATRSFSYSICRIFTNFIGFDFAKEQSWLIVGTNFPEAVVNISATPMPANFDSLFSALGDPIRIQIVFFLHQNGTQNTAQIQKHVSIAASSLSHQLRVLKKAGIVTSQKTNSSSYYSLNREIFNDIIHISKILKGEYSNEKLEETNLFKSHQ